LQRLRAAASGISPFACEITLILLFKIVLLWLIWWAFFSAPVARHMRLDPAQVQQQFLNSTSTAEPAHAKR
jgi:hypothetical protein